MANKKTEKPASKPKPVSKKLSEKDLKKLKGGVNRSSGAAPCCSLIGTW
jgi:hypothetical protein